MTWTANFSGHARSAEDEGKILKILADAAERVRPLTEGGGAADYTSQYHGAQSLHSIGGGVSTQDDPAPGTGGATPGGPGLGSGNATGGGGGEGGGG